MNHDDQAALSSIEAHINRAKIDLYGLSMKHQGNIEVHDDLYLAVAACNDVLAFAKSALNMKASVSNDE